LSGRLNSWSLAFEYRPEAARLRGFYFTRQKIVIRSRGKGWT
jgi:hypothetical protein